jgi:hypothetical protein
MLAGIFATKKRAACFATLRAEKRRRARRREPDQSGFAQPTERRRQSRLCPPIPNGSNYLSRFETGRPLYAVALSNYPSNCYGFAGAPVPPVAPVAPVAPGAPVAPVSPVAPVAPVAPVSPVAAALW